MEFPSEYEEMPKSWEGDGVTHPRIIIKIHHGVASVVYLSAPTKTIKPVPLKKRKHNLLRTTQIGRPAKHVPQWELLPWLTRHGRPTFRYHYPSKTVHPSDEETI